MTSRCPKIYNTVTLQEIIVLCLVAALFVAQPFGFGGPRIPFFTLSAIGAWLLLRDLKFGFTMGVYRLDCIFLLFLIPGLISFGNTYNVSKTTEFVFAVPTGLLAGIAIYSLLKNRVMMQVLIAVIAITSITWVFDAIIQFIFGKDLLGIPLMDYDRVGGPFQNTTHMGLLLSVTLPVTLKWLTRFGRFPQLGYLLCLGFILLLAGVRSDWVTYLVAVVLFYSWTKQGRIFLLVGLVPLLSIVTWFGITNSQIASIKTDQIVSIPTTYQDWNKLLSKRLDIWATCWNMAETHPVTGIGAKAFNHAYLEFKSDDDHFSPIDGNGGAYHAHHPWISILAETGFTGVLGLFGIVAFIFLLTIRSTPGLNLYRYHWLLTFVLILNPLNSMPPLFKIWWFPIVLLSIAAHLVDIEYEDTRVLPSNKGMK